MNGLKLIEHLETPIPVVTPKALDFGPYNSWSAFCAWGFDWLLASFITSMAVGAWMRFFGPLGFDHFTREASQVLEMHADRMWLLATPLCYFALTFSGILFSGRTLGLRLFKHQVHLGDNHVASAFKWAFGSTVMMGCLGMGWFREHGQATNFIDALAETATMTEQASYEKFIQQEKLVDQLSMDFDQAA